MLDAIKGLTGGIAFLFLAAVSLRLARFNVQASKVDYRYFVGVPSPGGALTLAQKAVKETKVYEKQLNQA